MVCGQYRLVGLLSLGLAACSSVGPTWDSGQEQQDIVGGQTDSTHKAVFGIVIKDQALCSGTLLAPNLILTARHCVADLSTGDAAIDCNTSSFLPKYDPSSFLLSYAADLTGTVSQSSVFQVSDVRVPDATKFCGNDIALLILSSNVPASAVTPIPPRVDQAAQDDEPFTAVGYGLTDPADTQGTTAGVRHQLSGVGVGCVGAVECAGTRATDTEWAANASICHGDSGGPAIDAQGRVIGVASRADTDCTFGLYSGVSPWQSLVVATAIDAATDGGYTPPAWTGTVEPTDGGMPDAGTGATGGSIGTGGTANSGGMGATSAGGRTNGGAGGRSGAAGRASGGRNAAGSGGTTSAGGTANSGGTTSTGGTANNGGTDNGGSDTSGTGGTGASSMHDAGTTPPDSGSDAGPLVKPGPELGEECTDGCFGDLKCYSRTSKPPGVCVEPCDQFDMRCPADSECNTSLGACVPKTTPVSSSKTTASASCGCRIGDDSASGSLWPTLGALAFCGGMLRRRRRAEHFGSAPRV